VAIGKLFLHGPPQQGCQRPVTITAAIAGIGNDQRLNQRGCGDVIAPQPGNGGKVLVVVQLVQAAQALRPGHRLQVRGRSHAAVPPPP